MSRGRHRLTFLGRRYFRDTYGRRGNLDHVRCFLFSLEENSGTAYLLWLSSRTVHSTQIRPRQDDRLDAGCSVDKLCQIHLSSSGRCQLCIDDRAQIGFTLPHELQSPTWRDTSGMIACCSS